MTVIERINNKKNVIFLHNSTSHQKNKINFISF